MTMNPRKQQKQILAQREKHLAQLTRALLESAAEEEDRARLELHRHVAVELAQLLDEAANKDNILHPDLGLELLLFIELKRDGNTEAEFNRRDVVKILDELM